MLGDVRLADNIAVGANAVVNKSFDEESSHKLIAKRARVGVSLANAYV